MTALVFLSTVAKLILTSLIAEFPEHRAELRAGPRLSDDHSGRSQTPVTPTQGGAKRLYRRWVANSTAPV
ncbi:hypothetical protein SKAU_G00311960 [Synaphobranchus kaupii]|uniref:Uncharacterized protein n=1 Tax=Synaphobranchus kaupii TaxID=118154 RepID=A0A9Q1ERZ4_SYNKA|nr:hypothetical protein SKAU_G00311960 [Synaphobranchus kaupii]